VAKRAPAFLAGRPYRRFQFEKCTQFFIRTHNETLSVAAMRVNRFGSFVFKL